MPMFDRDTSQPYLYFAGCVMCAAISFFLYGPLGAAIGFLAGIGLAIAIVLRSLREL